ncbi:hypothetical protein ABIB00_007795 [Bradyrhizobium sp. LB14.3]|uniref:hypothetical protein n=1 Tax=unclassified Bradyrhizobium TaxID=2631580 RepID=UPI001FF81443|nr:MULTISPECIES: hypothetical protein [unclassified Bradyrhizobium]
MNRMLLSLGTATLMALSIANAAAKDKQSETFLKKAIEGNFAEVHGRAGAAERSK